MSNRMRLSLISISCVLIFYIVLGGVLGRSDSPSSNDEKAYKDLGGYSEVLGRIKSDYVTEPDLKHVTDGAIRGLLEALDPYSTYLSPPQYKEYVDHPEPGPASVGMFLSKRAGFATVISVRSEEHTSELQSHSDLVCRLLLEKKKKKKKQQKKLKKHRSTEATRKNHYCT